MKGINSVFIKTNFTYTGPLRYIVTIAIFFYSIHIYLEYLAEPGVQERYMDAMWKYYGALNMMYISIYTSLPATVQIHAVKLPVILYTLRAMY